MWEMNDREQALAKMSGGNSNWYVRNHTFDIETVYEFCKFVNKITKVHYFLKFQYVNVSLLGLPSNQWVAD